MACICFINIGIQGRISFERREVFPTKRVCSPFWEDNPTSTAFPAEPAPVSGGHLCDVIWSFQKALCCWCDFLCQDVKSFP